jgi:acyl-CoA thioesterase I
MNRLIYYFIDGNIFFVGVGLMAAAALLSFFKRPKIPNVVINPLAIIGAVLILFSATPLPLGYYLVWTVVVLGWLVFQNIRSGKTLRTIFRFGAVLACCLAVLMEIPYHIRPSPLGEKFDTMYVIGDSISAGIMGRNENTWPKIIQDTHKVKAINLAVGGATVRTALKQADQVPHGKALVLLEIGGNDMLGRTPSTDFESDLGELILRLQNKGHTLVMLELPLLPFRNRYGYIQRKLVRRHKIVLIPKWYFASVLKTEGATLDGAHLSQKGDQIMAETMWNVLGNSLSSPEF